jgi:hypothetical protein
VDFACHSTNCITRKSFRSRAHISAGQNIDVENMRSRKYMGKRGDVMGREEGRGGKDNFR